MAPAIPQYEIEASAVVDGRHNRASKRNPRDIETASTPGRKWRPTNPEAVEKLEELLAYDKKTNRGRKGWKPWVIRKMRGAQTEAEAEAAAEADKDGKDGKGKDGKGGGRDSDRSPV